MRLRTSLIHKAALSQHFSRAHHSVQGFGAYLVNRKSIPASFQAVQARKKSPCKTISKKWTHITFKPRLLLSNSTHVIPGDSAGFGVSALLRPRVSETDAICKTFFGDVLIMSAVTMTCSTPHVSLETHAPDAKKTKNNKVAPMPPLNPGGVKLCQGDQSLVYNTPDFNSSAFNRPYFTFQ